MIHSFFERPSGCFPATRRLKIRVSDLAGRLGFVVLLCEGTQRSTASLKGKTCFPPPDARKIRSRTIPLPGDLAKGEFPATPAGENPAPRRRPAVGKFGGKTCFPRAREKPASRNLGGGKFRSQPRRETRSKIPLPVTLEGESREALGKILLNH